MLGFFIDIDSWDKIFELNLIDKCQIEYEYNLFLTSWTYHLLKNQL